MKKDVEITLKKDGSDDIIVMCPEKIKLHPVAALLAISYGLPPARIKPKQGKDILKAFALFLGIFVSLAVCYINVLLGIVLCVGFFVANFLFNKNYFFNFISKKLGEGYTVDTEAQKNILEKAGVFDKIQNSDNQSQNQKTSVFVKLNRIINRLPFNGLFAKMPILQKIAKYGNYIVCALIVLLLLGILSSKSPTDSYINDYEGIVKSMTKLVEQCENGDIAYTEFQKKMLDLVNEIDVIENKNKGKVDNNDLSAEQQRKLLKIMSDIEKLESRSENLQLEYYLY